MDYNIEGAVSGKSIASQKVYRFTPPLRIVTRYYKRTTKSTNMNNEKWNEICFLLSENIKKDISENSFEQNVIQALRVLDWKQFSGDYEIRPSYQIGAANRITPDFVIKSSDNHKLFVIEIKQPNIPLTSTFQQQLFSYMRQLKLEYGILIGQAIQIFYDGPLVNQEDPVLLDTIRFERNSEKGDNFVKLFSKESFNFDLLNEYTLQSLKKINRRQDFKLLLNTISSEDFKENIFSLIKQEFISEYDGELIDSALNELNIEITIKNKFGVNNSEQTRHFQHIESSFSNAISPVLSGSSRQVVSSNDRDYTKYIFHGQTLGKNRLVLAVLKDYVENNPGTTFSQLKAKFPDSLQGSETFTTENEANQKRDRRNFIRPNELISLIDTTTAVSTQWGLGNITRFIDHCKQMNIDIKVIQ